MSDESALIQPLLDDLRRGDADAISKLAELTYERLRKLTAKILIQSFGRLGHGHDLDSVLNNTYIRLHNSLKTMAVAAKTPPTPADFFRFAAYKIEQVLYDMASRDGRGNRRRVEPPDSDDSCWDPPQGWRSDDTDPGDAANTAAHWTELLDAVRHLPEPEQTVFRLHFLMGMTQAEIAKELNLSAKQVSRAWLKAASIVGDYMPKPD